MSAVRLAVIPYFASTPKSPSISSGDTRVRSVVNREMPYGLISMFLLAVGRSRPTSVAPPDTRNHAVDPPSDAGSGVRCAHSFLRRMPRRKLTPQVWLRPDV